MQILHKQFFLNALRILIGLFFIASGFAKLYPIEPFELQVVDTGVSNWTLAPYLTRFIIGFEILLGLFLTLGISLKFTFRAIFLLLLFFTIYLLYIRFILGITEDCGCFGSFLRLSPIPSILKNVVLLGLIYILNTHASSLFELKKYKKLLLCIFIPSAFISPFVLNTVDMAQTYHMLDEKVGKPIQLHFFDDTIFSGDTINLTKGHKLICFFTLGCPVCKLTAQKLAILQKQNNNQLPIYFVFLGHKEKSQKKLELFWKETKSEHIPYKYLDEKSFFSLAGLSLPSVYYLQDGFIINKTAYRDMVPAEIEEFLKPKP